MTKWTTYSTSPYMSAADFEAGEVKHLTIEAIRRELVGRDRAERDVAHFEERDERPLILNKTNQRKLSACCPRPEDAVGASVVLHVIETEYGGEPTEGVRIKLATPPAREPAVPPQAPPAKTGGATFAPNARARGKTTAVAEEMNDDIPF